MGAPKVSRRPVVAQARVLRRVRAGEQVRDAMASEGYSPRTADRWRSRYPDFSAQLDQAKHDAGALDPRKQAFLAALYAGATLDQAAARAGVSRSAGCNWAKRYHGFRATYRRITGRREAARRSDREAKRAAFFGALEAGATVRGAAHAAGIDGRTPYNWRRTRPELFARFRAILEGRSGVLHECAA
jgi:hypothetical protein